MATSNFAFEVKAILGLESTHLEIQVAKIGLNDPTLIRHKRERNVYSKHGNKLNNLKKSTSASNL